MYEPPVEKKYAIYLHGAGSGSKSASQSAFVHYFPQYEWLCPEMNEDPYESLEKLNEFISVFEPEIVAGTSLGGFYAAYSNAPTAIKIVCNTTIDIERVFRKLGYGKHPFYCEREDGRTEWEINESIVRRFTEFKNSNEILPGKVNLGIFSSADEIVGQVESRKNAKLLEQEGFRIYWSDKFGHRMNENVAKKIPAWLKENL